MNVQREYQAPTLTAVGSLAELTLQGVDSVFGSVAGGVAGGVTGAVDNALDGAVDIADIGLADQTIGNIATDDQGTLLGGANDNLLGGLFN